MEFEEPVIHTSKILKGQFSQEFKKIFEKEKLSLGHGDSEICRNGPKTRWLVMQT